MGERTNHGEWFRASLNLVGIGAVSKMFWIELSG